MYVAVVLAYLRHTVQHKDLRVIKCLLDGWRVLAPVIRTSKLLNDCVSDSFPLHTSTKTSEVIVVDNCCLNVPTQTFKCCIHTTHITHNISTHQALSNGELRVL